MRLAVDSARDCGMEKKATIVRIWNGAEGKPEVQSVPSCGLTNRTAPEIFTIVSMRTIDIGGQN